MSHSETHEFCSLGYPNHLTRYCVCPLCVRFIKFCRFDRFAHQTQLKLYFDVNLVHLLRSSSVNEKSSLSLRAAGGSIGRSLAP